MRLFRLGIFASAGCALLFAMMTAFGCAGGDDGAPAADDDDEVTDAGPDADDGPHFDDTFALFAGRCDRCHNAETFDANLDLSSKEAAYAQLVDVDATGVRCIDTG